MASVVEILQTVPTPAEILPEPSESGAEGVIQSTEQVEPLTDPNGMSADQVPESMELISSTENGQILAEIGSVMYPPVDRDELIRCIGLEPAVQAAAIELGYAPTVGGKVAHIDTIDRQVDAPVVRGPVDVQVWSSRVRNPA